MASRLEEQYTRLARFSWRGYNEDDFLSAVVAELADAPA